MKKKKFKSLGLIALETYSSLPYFYDPVLGCKQIAYAVAREIRRRNKVKNENSKK